MITIDKEKFVPTKDADGNDYFCPARVVDSVGRIPSADQARACRKFSLTRSQSINGSSAS